MARFGPQRRFVAKPTEVDGVRFASKGEAVFFAKLQQQERVGEISNLERQPSFRIEINGKWICTVKADAAFTDCAGVCRVQDYKGHTGDTPVSRLKRRLVEALHGVEIEVVGPAAKRKAKGSQRKGAAQLGRAA